MLEGLFEVPFKGPRLASCVACGTTEIQRHRQVCRAWRRGALGAEVPGHHQQQLMQALIVHLLKTHFFTLIKSQQNIIELVTRPGDDQVGGRDSLYFAVLVGDLAKVRWLVESGEVCADSRFYFRGETRHIMHIAIATGQERIGNKQSGGGQGGWSRGPEPFQRFG